MFPGGGGGGEGFPVAVTAFAYTVFFGDVKQVFVKTAYKGRAFFLRPLLFYLQQAV